MLLTPPPAAAALALPLCCCRCCCSAALRTSPPPPAFPADPERKLDTLTPRLLYCVIQLGQVVFALHKLAAMGLLPTHASDWLSAVAAPTSLEAAYAPA